MLCLTYKPAGSNVGSNKFAKRPDRPHPFLSGKRQSFDWLWDHESKSECVSLSEDRRVAYFYDNPYTISRGTAGIRGSEAVQDLSGIYYFEILIREPLYGTAIMIGYGTDQVKLHYGDFDYVNLIGYDVNSWGLCHKGTVWHNRKPVKYCEPFFDKDTVIGCMLNTHDKTIHYFMNGHYLGVAFRDVNPENKQLYPMISSTATDVELELLCSYRLIYSLQQLCCQSIFKHYECYDSLPLAKMLIDYIKNYKKSDKDE